MMNTRSAANVYETRYDRNACEIGVVHIGYGAFHRAHQAVYLDDYMEKTGDLAWGIAAVNLRRKDSVAFAQNAKHDYLLKSISPEGEVSLRRVRSHAAFTDWAANADDAELLLAADSVFMATITVTESGYYTDPTGALDAGNATIKAELNGAAPISIYGYLLNGLRRRMARNGNKITICCCDNIRQNGKMLRRNFAEYLRLIGAADLAVWVNDNVTFPCSMVDRITPRSTATLETELSGLTGKPESQPIMAEAFSQWVLEDNFANKMPDIAAAGVTVTADVDPYEETKIRVLNGGHTCLTYLAALHGLETFDQAMQVPELFEHFWHFETHEVLTALTLDLPFSKTEYLENIAARFKNQAIGDTIARICADGMAKFPIFIRPTLAGCLAQGVMPHHGIKSIASWHVFTQHVIANKIPFEYLEPGWAILEPMIGTDAFVTSKQLWGELPTTYPKFADALRVAIKNMEQSWPI